MLDNRTVTMGLIAAHKIWVYDPADDPERPAVRRPRAAAKAGAPEPDARQGALRASERLHRLRDDGPLLRRALGRARGDPGDVLPDPHRRRDHPLRHRRLPARRPRPPAPGSPRPLRRRRPPGASPRRARARARATSTWSCSRTCTSTMRAAPTSFRPPSWSRRRTSTPTRSTPPRSSPTSTTGRTSTCPATAGACSTATPSWSPASPRCGATATRRAISRSSSSCPRRAR